MRPTSRGILRSGVGLLCGCGAAVWGSATTTTYIGPAAPADWSTPANWNNGVPVTSSPSGPAWSVVFTGAVDFTSSLNVPTALVSITTGAGLVKFPGGMTLAAGTGYTPSGSVTVGSGGASFNGPLDGPYGGTAISAAGDFKFTGLSFGNNASITQTGGAFDMTGGSLSLPINMNPFSIQSWRFSAGPAVITGTGAAASDSFRFDGTPVFLAGQRPNWTLSSYADTPGRKWDLNGQGLFGNVLTITAGGSPGTRLAYLYNRGAGASVDVNQVAVGGGYANSYLDLQNTTITVRGAGTAWDNQSTNNALFDLTTSTTTVFDPTAGSMSVHTGSQDLGAASGSYSGNFAFSRVRIGAGDTVTLTGSANVGGGAMAMYAKGGLQGGNGSTLALGSRNLFVTGALTPGDSIGTFNVTGGNATTGVNLSLGSMAVEFGTGAADRLNVPGGLLTLGGTAILTLTDLGTILATPLTGDTFVIAQYSTRSGSFANTILGPGAFTYTLQYDKGAGSNEIWLTVIPEPGMLALFGLAGLAALRTRRGRARQTTAQ